MNELEIFTEALLRTDAAQRAAYLEQVCGQDAALRGRVEQLLAFQNGGCSPLDRGPDELVGALGDALAAADVPTEPPAGQLAPILGASERPGALGRLGHYDVLEVLGQGGFGIVVKAFDDRLHRIVAIKVLSPHLAVTSPPRKRFIREARAAAQVKHENVVQIYAVEELPIPFLVMEFVEGLTLQEKLGRDGPLDPPEVVRLGRQVALGLAAAHEKGLVHRDVKPANILIEAGVESRAKLTDFGLARAGDDASLTQSGVIAGTPMFMSPEQAIGEDLDHRADLFSLGSVLYTMVTGHPPFRAPNTLAVLKRLAEDTPRPIRQVIPDVPQGLCDVVTRLLAKEPGKRYGTAGDAAEALATSLTAPHRPAPRRRVAFAAAVGLLVAALVWGWFQLPRSGETGGAAGGPLVVTSANDDGAPARSAGRSTRPTSATARTTSCSTPPRSPGR